VRSYACFICIPRLVHFAIEINLFTRGVWHRTENLLYKLDLDPMDRLNNSAICPEWFNGLVQLP
jgi:hypothetical protein